MLVSAVLAPLGFAGFGIWPLAFLAYVPWLLALDTARLRGLRAVLVVAFLFGFVADWGGYWWLVPMLVSFSGFSTWLCIVFASLLIAYTCGTFVLAGVLWARGRDRGWNATLVAVCTMAGAELVWPLLFPYFYGTSFHGEPVLLQIADLGGPTALTALAFATNGALFELASARLAKRPLPRAAPLAALGFLVFTLGYGLFRIHAVAESVRAAPKITVGVVQADMGLLEHWDDPIEGQRRHIDQSLDLERDVRPDLIIWPESAIAFFVPESTHNLQRSVLGAIRTPVLFGGLSRRRVDGVGRDYNTAFITDAAGDVRGTYDKQHLLAFGEYLPFADVFPQLYEISRNSGRFTPGDRLRALPFGRYRITTLICYEDVLPTFVRRAVAAEDPHLLVNVTNDAWFGDTHEPWVHLALAKLRAVEHHRYLIRATNSGVSAIVDPTGYVVTRSGTFDRENLHAEVAMLRGTTLYELLGDWPAYLSIAFVLFACFIRRGDTPRPPTA